MRPSKKPAWLRVGWPAVAVVVGTSCFDQATRWQDPPPVEPLAACAVGQVRCGAGVERCDDGAGGPGWVVVDDCPSQGLVCAPSLLKCTKCLPDEDLCEGLEARTCHHDGMGSDVVDTCDPSVGEACRSGTCLDLCGQAVIEKSNVGCEYWAVDLDNAMIDLTSNAAAQQFAVVVSNPQPDVPAVVHIFQDDSLPGEEPAPYEIATTTIAPRDLEVFKLGPREIDGSPDGEYDTGSHTALTRHAYRVTTDFPVVAYQFNPLENANVFSNDASLLKPREALQYEGQGMARAYVVASWPQTIAVTDDPNTNFNPLSPINLRAFLTIVGTKADTHVRVKTTAAVVGGGPVPETAEGGTVEATLGAFDVLNLETGDFNADFTGSIVEADGPVAVFVGGEASDAPHFETLSERRCCADHLEDQLDPIRTAGKSFAIPHTPSRTSAVLAAGADITVVPEPDYNRFVSASDHKVIVKTTLPPPDDEFLLAYLGDWHEVTAFKDFMAEADGPVIVAQIMASQDAAGVKRGLPGGDPSLLIVPPREQFRPDYTFLTPDKYVLDFVSIVAPPAAVVLLDDVALSADRCVVTPADGLTKDERGSETPPLVVYTCQLSFAIIDPLKEAPDNVKLGIQNDGVHRLVSDAAVGVVVSGFDNYVSYSYAAGTELKELGLAN